MVRSFTCNVLHMRQFCRFVYCLAWFDTDKFNRLLCSKNEMYDDAVFANLISLSIGYVWNSCIDMAISILSCWYCICSRYWQNNCSILPNFLLFARFDTLEFNRLPCSNNKIYDDADFANRFRYQLAMLGIRVLIWLSWLLHAHITYITDGAKIIAAFSRISYCLHDFMRLNSIVGDV